MSGRTGGARTALVRAGAVAVVAVTAALTVLLVLVLFDRGEPAAQPSAEPALLRDVTLRSAPRDDADPVASLQQGIPVVLVGRTGDAAWLVLELPGRSVIGWAPAGAVANVGDVEALPVVGDASETAALPSPAAAGGAPTATPDFPDLVIEAVFSRDNRLAVVVTNLGNADIEGAIFVAVAGATPVRIDIGGKPLRPGDTLEAVLPDEYVQLRAVVTVEVRPSEGVEEEDTANNRFETIIEPDIPNDLELLSVELGPEPATLTITVRNNSVIPLVGTVTIAVRQTAPSTLLLGRFQAPLEIEAGGTQSYQQRFDVADADALDLARIQVILSSDAINDARESNNIFPR